MESGERENGERIKKDEACDERGGLGRERIHNFAGEEIFARDRKTATARRPNQSTPVQIRGALSRSF